MLYQPFFIEAFKTGLEKDKSDFQLFPDAFSVLQDAFIWRDRIARKKGYEKVGRLLRVLTAQALGNTTGTPHTGNIKTVLGLEANAEIHQGSISIVVAAPNTETFTEPATPDGALVGSGGGTGTVNYYTGAYTLVSGTGWGVFQAITAAFDYAPALPCMGIWLRELTAINAEMTVAFDTSYVYFWDTTSQRFIESGAGTTWLGDDSQFFGVMNYYSTTAGGDIMVTTNFNKGVTPDPIRYYSTFAGTWNALAPAVDGAGNEIHQALIIIPYKGRLVALNTWEGANLAASTQNARRARWSQNGDALQALAWRSDTAGRGGYIDAPTSEHIISASFIRDTLIVGFEKSLWRLRYTGNEILPFVWERIDNEFGVESTYSIVLADKAQISIGQTGIVACDAMNAKRIDNKIPDEVFKIHNENNGIRRVHGVRDYDKKLMYWTMPTAAKNRTFPDNLLVFNYDNSSWAIFKDSLTCFGVLQEFEDKVWEDYPDTKWELAEFSWIESELQALYPAIIAGNQHGYIVKMQRFSRNDPAFAITVITTGTPVQLTIPNHNLSTGDYIQVSGILGTSNTLNDISYKANYIDEDNFSLSDENGIPITLAAGSTYLGGGEIAILHDYRVRTKKFNFLEGGKAIGLGYIDFLVNKTSNGEFNIDIYADNNDSTPMNVDDTFFNTTVSTQPYDSDIVGQNKLLHRFYSSMHVQFLQFELNLTGAQKINDEIHDSDIEIYSMTLWLDKTGRTV